MTETKIIEFTTQELDLLWSLLVWKVGYGDGSTVLEHLLTEAQDLNIPEEVARLLKDKICGD